MTKEKFTETLRNIVSNYIDNYNEIGADALIGINSVTGYISVYVGDDIQSDIADSVEAIEEAAAADNPEAEDAADYQAKQNPDFYALSRFIERNPDGNLKPNTRAISHLVTTYFP